MLCAQCVDWMGLSVCSGIPLVSGIESGVREAIPEVHIFLKIVES